MSKHKKKNLIKDIFSGLRKFNRVLLILGLALLLVACGNPATRPDNGALVAAPVTPTPEPAATPEPSPTAVPATPAPLPTATPVVAAPPTATPVTTKPAATPTATPQPEPEYKPVIWFGASNLKVGDTLVVGGSGYPAATKLVVALGVNGNGPAGSYAQPVTDAKGQFSARIKLDKTQDNQPFKAGRVVVAVSTEDKSVAAGAAVTLTEATPGPTTTPVSGNQGGAKWIDVDLTRQKLVAYEGNRAVFSTLISSGTSRHPTVTGTFSTYLKYVSQRMTGGSGAEYYDLPNVPYVMYFYQDYAIHGAYWHNNFGHPMSHGCVNTPVDASKFLYNWAPAGTTVKVHY